MGVTYHIMNQLGAVCATLVATVSCFPYPQGGAPGPLPIPRPGSDGSYGGDNHFQYINVPAHKTFEWGYRRGNPDHNREEYLSQKDHTFKAKLKWHDGYGGHGNTIMTITMAMLDTKLPSQLITLVFTLR